MAREPLKARGVITLVQMYGFGVITPVKDRSRAALYALVACMTLSHAMSPRSVWTAHFLHPFTDPVTDLATVSVCKLAPFSRFFRMV